MKGARSPVERSVARFVELEGFDRAMALAGQAFAALLPLLIVVAAVSPTGGRDLSTRLIDTFDLTGSSAASLQEAVAQPATVQNGASAVGLFILLVSALSFTRALQRLYERAWSLPSLGLRGNGHGLIWLAGFSVYLALNPALGPRVGGTAGVVLTLATGSALWLITPWALLGRRLSWKRLLPQALLTSISLAVLSVASALYMPRAVSSSASQFGVIGVAFALLSWLFLAGMVLVVTAALGAVLAEPQGPTGITRRG